MSSFYLDTFTREKVHCYLVLRIEQPHCARVAPTTAIAPWRGLPVIFKLAAAKRSRSDDTLYMRKFVLAMFHHDSTHCGVAASTNNSPVVPKTRHHAIITPQLVLISKLAPLQM